MSDHKRTGLFVGLGCGCLSLVILAVIAIIYLVRGGFESARGLMGDMARHEALAGQWQGPTDERWDAEDWPERLEGGWTLADTSAEPIEFLGQGWSSRTYDGADGSSVTVHVGPTDPATQNMVSDTLAEYAPTGASSTSVTMGPRQTRRIGSGSRTEAYELWKLTGWTILVAGDDGDVVADAAEAFLTDSGRRTDAEPAAEPPSATGDEAAVPEGPAAAPVESATVPAAAEADPDEASP